MAMAARMPMMATTIISSIRVKPRWLPSTFLFLFHMLIISQIPPCKVWGLSTPVWKLAFLVRRRSTFGATSLRGVTPSVFYRRGESRPGSTASADGWRQPGNPKWSGVRAQSFAHHVVLLELVAELAKGHLQQFGRLGLHAARPVERSLEIPALEIVKRCFQIEAVLGDLENPGTSPVGSRVAHRRGE